MIVLGLVGEKGSGKQTFVNFLKQIASSPSAPRNDNGEALNIRQVRFSDILAETLLIWDIPITRSNLQHLAIMMEDTFGQSALAQAAKFSIEGDEADIIIFDGIRRESEFNLVKDMAESRLIYITAEQKLRYERLKRRSEKVGETGLTFEQFLAEEESKAEKAIPALGKQAGVKLDNNGTLDEFKQKIGKLAQTFGILKI
ncbi:AAA family ATPase [Candidatus Daviesbacteria bacterium]|nr:AAA family ATPase [Candidatus Daviesbacteria bacterium]